MAGAIEVFADLDVSVNGEEIRVKAEGDTISINLPTLGTVRKIRGMMFGHLQDALTFLRGQGIEVHILAGKRRIAKLEPKEQKAA